MTQHNNEPENTSAPSGTPAARTGTNTKLAAVIINPAKAGGLRSPRRPGPSSARRQGWAEPLWLETTKEDPGVGQAK